MSNSKARRGKLALIGIPVAGAILLGAGGYAWAATPTPNPPSQSQTGQQGAGQSGTTSKTGDAADATDRTDGQDAADHDKQDHDKPSYTSSVKTTANDESGSDAAQDVALAKLAKISLGQAADAAVKAVPGSVATGVELENEGGNVVFQVDVATQTQETEVVIDAGTGTVLAKTVETDD